MNRSDRRKAAKTNKDRVEEYISAGVQLLQQGSNLAEARSLFKQVLSIDPRNARACHYLGLIEMWSRNYTKATEMFERAAKLDPENPGVLNNLGLSLHEQGRIEDATGIYMAVLQLDHKNLEAAVNLARGLLHLGRLDEAEEAARNAIEINPEFGNAQLMLGTITQIKGEADTALQALEKAVTLLPGNAEASLRLSRAAYDPASEDSYIKPIRQAYKDNPENVEAASVLADLLYGSGHHKEAIETLVPHREATGLGPRLNILNGLANIHADMNDFDQAVEYHKKALSVASDEPNTRFFYGRTLLQSGDAKGAMVQFRKAMPALKNSQEALALIATAQRHPGVEPMLRDPGISLVSQFILDQGAMFSSIADHNEAVLKEMSALRSVPTHPLDKERRLTASCQESSLVTSTGPATASLADSILEAIKEYISKMPDGDTQNPTFSRKSLGIGMTRSWTESVSQSPARTFSIDQSGWLIGVYFHEVPSVCDDESAKSGWLRFGVPTFHDAVSNKPIEEIKPEPGKFVIFPASSWYGLNAMDSKTPMTLTTVLVNSGTGQLIG